MLHDSAGSAEKWKLELKTRARMLSPAPVTLLISAATSLVMVVFVWFAYAEDMRSAGAWGCAMSWMTPRFVQQSSPSLNRSSSAFDRYALYLYREDGWDLSDSPTGLPVIFLPGNAGSMKQCRSIASSAAKQFYHSPGQPSADWFEEDRQPRPIDIFAIDFKEELSALHSPTLRRQADYVAHAIPHVLSFYEHLPKRERPEKVTLVGHSMGGIVAKLALTFDEGLAGLVDGILTMSTPHTEPPFNLDSGMSTLYRRIDRFWVKRLLAGERLPPLVSVCGGIPDSQIPSEICVLPPTQAGPLVGFTVFTTAIEGVWTGVEHQAIVWCHQVRYAIARILLNSKANSRYSFLGAAKELLLTSRQQHIDYANVSERHILRLSPSTAHSMLCNFPINGVGPRGVPSARLNVCSGYPESGTCSHDFLVDLSWLPRIERSGQHVFPGLEGARESEGLVLVHVEALTPGHYVIIDTNGPGSCLLQENGPVAVTTGHVLAQEWTSQANESRHTQVISLSAFIKSPLLAYTITPKNDRKTCTAGKILSPCMRFTTSSSKAHVYEHRFFSAAIPATLHSHVIHEASFHSNPTITIYQDPQDPCRVTSLEVRVNWRHSLAKTVLRLRTAIVAWTVGVIALVLREQGRQRRRLGQTLTFTDALQSVSTRACLIVWLALSTLGLVAPGRLSVVGISTYHYTLLPGSAALMNASVTIAASLGVMLQAIVSLQRTIPKRTVSDSVKQQVSSNGTLDRLVSGLDRRACLETTCLAVLAASVVPRQACQLYLMLRISTRNDERIVKVPVCVLLLLLSIFHIPVVVVWLRQLFVHGDWRFTTNHDILHLIPSVAFHVSTTFKPHIKYSSGCLETAGTILSFFAFFYGPKYPGFLPTLSEIVVLVSALF